MAGEFHVGSAEVTLVPDARGFDERVDAATKDLKAKIRLILDDAQAKAQLRELTRQRTAIVNTKVDAKKTQAEIDRLARKRTAEVKVDDKGSAKKTDRNLQPLLTTIVALAPAVAPLSAALAGAAVGAAGLGVAGLLAFKGIEAEIKRGTPLGLEYQSMLNGVEAQVAKLEHTAAAGVLTGFNHALGDTEQALPQLDREVGVLSTSLGSDLGPIVHGVLALFLTANPVINDTAGGIHEVAVEFDKWASGPGGRAFIAYIQAVLPEVVSTVEALAQASEHVVQGLLPLGGPVLGAIRGVSDAIAHIPLPIIQDLFVAFLGYKSIILTQKSIEGVTKALAALGIVEEATAGAGAAGGVGAVGRKGIGGLIGRGASGLGLAGAGVGGTVGGVLAGVGVGVVAAQLIRSHDNAAEAAAAQRLAAGGPSAIAAARGRLAVDNIKLGQQTPGLAFTAEHGGIARGASGNQGQLAGNAAQLQREINLATGAMTKAAAANKALGLSADGTRDAITGETVALAQQIAANDKLSAANVTVRSTTIGVHQAAADADAALKANGRTLNENTQKGRDNATALLNLGTAMRGHIDALAADHTSVQKVNAVLSTSEDKLIKVAEKFGLSATQARKYADQVLGLPATASVHFLTPGLAQALRGVNSLNTALEAAYTLGGQAGAAAARAVSGSQRSSVTGVPLVTIASRATPTGPHGAPAPAKRKRGATGGLFDGEQFHFDNGGRVFGYGSSVGDQVDAKLSPGEFIMRAASSASIGYENLAMFNRLGGRALPLLLKQRASMAPRPQLPGVNIGAMYAADPAEAVRLLTQKQHDAAVLYSLLAPA